MVDECLFCKIVKGELPSEKVFENGDFIVIKDVNPKVVGHMLVVSKEHYENFMDLDSGLYGKMLETVRDAVSQEGIKDFNLIVNKGRVAGQLVGHFHLHILPRVEDDGFVLNC